MTTTDVAAAVESLLRSIPERWTDFDHDELSAAEQRAVFLLVAAGLVERRIGVRGEFAGQAPAIECTIDATGEYGVVEALEPVAAEVWTMWGPAFAAWKTKDAAASTPFRFTRTGLDRWRLTEQGAIARNDLDIEAPSPGAAAFVGSRQRALEFVLRTGHQANRPPVRGEGRLVEVRSGGGPAPAPVALANAGEVAAAFREARAPVIQAALQGGAAPPDEAAPGGGVSWKEAMAAAEAHVKKHGGFFPGRNELARLVGCSPSTMTKAIKRSTYLRARAEESKQGRVREVQLGTPIESAPADDDAPRRSDLSGGESEPAGDPVDAYHAGGDDEDERDVVISKLAAQQRSELMREERQRRRAAKDGKLG
ncbi:MAG: hypothetical protein ACF8R9_09890 [Phycisphaerales bacterium JB054]